MEDLTLYQLAASCVAVLESAGIPEEGIFSFRYLAGKAAPESSNYGENDDLFGDADGEYTGQIGEATQGAGEHGSSRSGSLTQESGDEPGDEKTRDALSLVRACTKSADLLKDILRRPDPEILPDAAACAALGSAAAAILGCAEGASLHVYAGTRLFRDRTRAKSLNSSALREIKKVRKAVEEVREKVFKELTTL